METETHSPETPFPTPSTLAVAEPLLGDVPIPGAVNLAPPYDVGGWGPVPASRPRGFRCQTHKRPRVYDHNLTVTASVDITMEADPASAPERLTVGWCWDGWRRPIRVTERDSFLFQLTVTGFFQPPTGGGSWVPKAFLSVHDADRPKDDSRRIEVIRNLRSGYPDRLFLRLDRPGNYLLSTGFSVRSAYRPGEHPQGRLYGVIHRVVRFDLPRLGLADDAALEGNDDEVRTELARLALAD